MTFSLFFPHSEQRGKDAILLNTRHLLSGDRGTYLANLEVERGIMNRSIWKRIEELKERLSNLRSHKPDSTCDIAIEAIEQELARTAARLPREWNVVWSTQLQDPITEGAQDDSRWSL